MSASGLGGIDTVRGYEDYEIFPINANTGTRNPNGGNKVPLCKFGISHSICKPVDRRLVL